METRKKIRGDFNLKSLEDVWLSLFVFTIQVVCVYRGWLSLAKYSSQSWLPNPKPFVDIWSYALFILICILLLPLFVASSLLRIGSYSNDNFKIGSDLDVKSLLEKLTHRNRQRRQQQQQRHQQK